MKTTVRSKPFSCELAPRGYVAPGPWGLGTAAPASALLAWGLGGWGRARGGNAGDPALPQPEFRGDGVRVTRSSSPHTSALCLAPKGRGAGKTQP